MDKSPSADFDIQIAHSIQEIGQETWDRLSGDRPLSSHRWYRFGETVMAHEKPIYVALSLGGEPVACAAFRLLKHEQGAVQSRLLRHLIVAILRRRPLLLCESPLGVSSGLFLPDDPSLRDVALRTLARIAQDQARQHRVSFLVFSYLEDHEAQYPGWPDDFATTELASPIVYLDTTAWPDFDSYLSHLSRKRRKHYRRHLRHGDRMGVEITLHPTVTDVDGAMALMRNVQKKYRERDDPAARRLLENAGMVDVVWIAVRVGDRLVGCELVVGDRGYWRVLALGRDYDYQDVYFLLGYADIRYTIEHGAQALIWGAFSYDAKQRLGFVARTNTYAVFTGNGPLFHNLARWVAKREEGRSVADSYTD
jgi:predicted N-acyltransferase